MKLHRAVLVVAVVLLCVTAVSAQPAKREFQGITNFTQVEPDVATGGRTALEAFPRLKADGFTAVISLLQEDEEGADIPGERKAAEAAGIKYFHAPFSGTDPKPAAVEAFLETVATVRDESLFIHCMSGNRVGTLWLIKRVVQDGWPVEKATQEAEVVGLTRPALKQFALDYVKSHAPK